MGNLERSFEMKWKLGLILKEIELTKSRSFRGLDNLAEELRMLRSVSRDNTTA